MRTLFQKLIKINIALITQKEYYNFRFYGGKTITESVITKGNNDIPDEFWNVYISPKLTRKNYKEGYFR